MILSNECWIKDNCKKYKNGECVENNYCVKLFKLDNLYTQSLLSANQRLHINLYLDSDNSDKDQFVILSNISENIVDFVSSGKNLYIHSSITGNGKTAWAIRMMQSYFNNIWHSSGLECRALFINVPKFFLKLKDSISHENEYINHIKENVEKADLVVWDEIGTKLATVYEQENLLSIINNRIDDGKANIYTSNLSPDELRDKIGDRLYSRIINCSVDVELRGQDKRFLMKGELK